MLFLGLLGALAAGLGLTNLVMKALGRGLKQETGGDPLNFGPRFTLIFLGVGLLTAGLTVWICR